MNQQKAMLVKDALHIIGLEKLIGMSCAFVSSVWSNGFMDFKIGVIADPDSCSISEEDETAALYVEVAEDDDFALYPLEGHEQVVLLITGENGVYSLCGGDV